MSEEPISDERLRNTRAWAASRIGSLAGAEVIVGAITELLKLRLAEKQATRTDQAPQLNPKLTVEVALLEAARCRRYPDPVLNEQIIVVLADEVLRLRRGAPEPAGSKPVLHEYIPHPLYPWFCEECGYSKYEPLKHPQPKKAPAPQCPETWQSFDDGNPVQCDLPAGHDGAHVNAQHGGETL